MHERVPLQRTEGSSSNQELAPETKLDVELKVCCIYFVVSVVKLRETDLEVCSGRTFKEVQNL